VDYLHTEPLSKLVVLPMNGSPPIICLKCGSNLVWIAQPYLVYRTPNCVCHTEEQCVCHTEEQLVSPCHKSFARQTVLVSVAPLQYNRTLTRQYTLHSRFQISWKVSYLLHLREPEWQDAHHAVRDPCLHLAVVHVAYRITTSA